MRERKLRAARFICEVCGKNRATQVHHLNYQRVHGERLSDLQAICPPCHQKAHPDKFILNPIIEHAECPMCPETAHEVFIGEDWIHHICLGCGFDQSVHRKRPVSGKRTPAVPNAQRKRHRVPCPICGKTLADKKGLSSHTKAKHSAPKYHKPTIEDLEHDRREQERDRVLSLR